MEYIIIHGYSSRNHDIETDYHGFIEKFDSYEDAASYAKYHTLNNFEILALCSEEKNYLV